MSVEAKIKQLLGRNQTADQLSEAADGEQARPRQGSSQDATVQDISTSNNVGTPNSRDTSKSGKSANAGDGITRPKQGNSIDPDFEEVEDNVDANKAAAKTKKDTSMTPKTPGDVTKPSMSAQNTNLPPDNPEPNIRAFAKEDLDISAQIKSIFGEDLSEDFKNKATSIFEAAVIARVNNEMEKVSTKLEEQMTAQLVEYKDTLVEKVDGYLNYIVEQWMEENKIAVDNGLRTEIAEDFISGLKNLFQEHYIEVPEEKYNVMDELQAKVEKLSDDLNEAINTNIEVSKELSEIKRARIFEEQTKDLASTEVEKLQKLVEGIDLESEELYREKVSVIKENYFPRGVKSSPEQVLIEESGVNNNAEFADDTSVVSRYAQAISRSVKSR